MGDSSALGGRGRPVKRSPVATIRRTARRAATWRPKVTGAEPVDIAYLISPLRYDVAVRAQFFEFLSSRPEGDSASLVAAAREQPYFAWFEKVAMARFRPWVLADRQVFLSQFAERVTSAAALWRSFQDNGYDAEFPVTLRRTARPGTTDTGAVIGPRLHVGDGGHRLALLLASGQQLEPWMYRVDRRQRPLVDNTAVLVRALALPEPDYARFLSRGYLDEELASVPAIRAAVQRQRPERLAELDSVLAAHLSGVQGTS